jgi:hypothetical protein
MKSKRNEMNTNHFSPERIWVNKQIASHYFNAGNNTPDALIQFLADAKKKAEDEGYVSVKVVGFCDHDDYDGGDYEYLNVTGMRLETDKEYKRRLEDEISRMKHEKQNYDNRRNYYVSNIVDTPSPYDKRVSEYKEALKKI